MIIAFVSGKGGVGKTSIVANLGAALVNTGKSVLLVDADFFTRGLTFLMAKGTFHFDFSLIDLLSQVESKKPRLPTKDDFFEINSVLHLLPSLKDSFEFTATSEIEKILHGNLKQARNLLTSMNTDYGGELFDFVLIDTRSGADFLSIFPALIADVYWVITEEDVVSQGTSNLLMNILAEHGKREGMKTVFDAFIINKCITTRLGSLVKFLELSVFRASCASIILLNRNVRKAFVNEQLITTVSPGNIFSKEIGAMVKRLTHEHVRPFLARLRGYSFSQRMIETVYPAISMFGALAAGVISVGYFLFTGMFVDPKIAIMLVTLIIGAAGALGIILYSIARG